MKQGMIFDINEFAVHDGPGIRTTVFLKGCPLRCQWCHNPEGLAFSQQLLAGSNGCTSCGACAAVCKHPDGCVACAECIRACPKNLRRFAGKLYSSGELANMILKNEQFLLENGGVTFSGGEPLAQPEFLFETVRQLKPLHVALETCGYTKKSVFEEMLSIVDLVLMDIKHADDAKHKFYTGVSNQIILDHLKLLKNSEKAFIIRVPVIPGANDSVQNMQQTATLLEGCRTLQRVELLRYHKTAAAKYELLGKKFPFHYERETPSIEPLVAPFKAHGIPVFVP